MGLFVYTIEIDLEKSRDYKLSEFVDEIMYIKLKTPDDVLGDGLVRIKDKLIHAKLIKNDLSNFPKRIQLSYSNSGGVHCKPWFQNQLVSVISPASDLEMDSTVFIESIGEVSAVDNPIVVFMKLKD